MPGIGGKILETIVSEKKRIEWIDFFKAFAILLVVIGHATPIFNKYIYQFHVAAFFFIAGYVSNLEKKRIEEVVINRFFSLFIPYTFFALIGVSLIWVLSKCGVLGLVSTITEVPNLIELCQSIYTSLRCDWLGATWFIIALLGATLIQKVLLTINGNKVGVIYCLLTVLLFYGAYEWKSVGYCPFNIKNFTLFSIVQFYYALGIIAKKVKDIIQTRFEIKPYFNMLMLLVNIVLFYVFGNVLMASMDIVSLTVNNPVLDTILVLNGCTFLWNISMLVSRIPWKMLKKCLNYIGRNTMGILFLHFLGFKIVTCVLVFLNKTDITSIALLCPPSWLSNTLWFVYTVVAVLFSLTIWWLLQKNKVTKFFIGDDRNTYKRIYEKILNHNGVTILFGTIDKMTLALGKSYSDIWKTWKNDKIGLALLVICLIALVIYVLI